MSPASRNWFFATGNLPYMVPPRSPLARYIFVATEPTTASFWMHIALAVVAAVIMIDLGFRWGEWMRRIRR